MWISPDRLVERLLYFDSKAVLLLENLVDFLPEIAPFNVFGKIIGPNIFIPIIPAQTFNFQQTWKFLSRIIRGFLSSHTCILCEFRTPSYVNSDLSLNIT